jgi:Putative MetA-pathway of phenol degradation
VSFALWVCLAVASKSYADSPDESGAVTSNTSHHLVPPTESDDELDNLADAILEVLAEEEENPSAFYFDDESLPQSPNNGIEKLSDRRRLGDATSILFKGRVLLEAGYSFTSNDDDDLKVTEHIFPDLLLRYNLTQRIELRVGWPGIIVSKFDDDLTDTTDTYTDSTDPTIGLKFVLWNQKRLRPRMLMVASLPITSKGNPFSQNNFQPFFNTIYGWELNQDTFFSGSSGLSIQQDSTDEYFDYIQSFTLDRSFSDRLGGYVNFRSTFPNGSKSDEHMLFGGLYLYLTDNLQLDARAGFGLNETASDLVLGLGVSMGF